MSKKSVFIMLIILIGMIVVYTLVKSEKAMLLAEHPFMKNYNINNKGMVAMIRNNILYVNINMSQEFKELNHHVVKSIWSPDSHNLLYAIGSLPESNYDVISRPRVEEYRIWNTIDFSDVSLLEKFPDYHAPNFAQEYWSLDGKRIIIFDGFSLSILDLSANTVVTFAQSRLRLLPPIISTEGLVVSKNCGNDCYSLVSYDYNGNELWNKEFTNTEIQADIPPVVIPNRNTAIIVGRFGFLDEVISVGELDLQSGKIHIIKEMEQEQWIGGVSLSPNQELLAIRVENPKNSALYVVDLEGDDLYIWESSYLIAWRPGGGATLGSVVDNTISAPYYQYANRLVFFTFLNNDPDTIIIAPQEAAGPGYFSFVGNWSPNGKLFLIDSRSDHDEPIEFQLWEFETGQNQSLPLNQNITYIENVYWVPSEEGFYFTGNMPDNSLALWYYDLIRMQLTEVTVID